MPIWCTQGSWGVKKHLVWVVLASGGSFLLFGNIFRYPPNALLNKYDMAIFRLY